MRTATSEKVHPYTAVVAAADVVGGVRTHWAPAAAVAEAHSPLPEAVVVAEAADLSSVYTSAPDYSPDAVVLRRRARGWDLGHSYWQSPPLDRQVRPVPMNREAQGRWRSVFERDPTWRVLVSVMAKERVGR